VRDDVRLEALEKLRESIMHRSCIELERRYGLTRRYCTLDRRVHRPRYRLLVASTGGARLPSLRGLPPLSRRPAVLPRYLTVPQCYPRSHDAR
jgi:hypothetical protein